MKDWLAAEVESMLVVCSIVHYCGLEAVVELLDQFNGEPLDKIQIQRTTFWLEKKVQYVFGSRQAPKENSENEGRLTCMIMSAGMQAASSS